MKKVVTNTQKQEKKINLFFYEANELYKAFKELNIKGLVSIEELKYFKKMIQELN